MDNLVEQMKAVNNLADISGFNQLDSNDILLAVIQSKKYSLIEGHNIHINVNNKESLDRLLEKLLSYEDYLYDMRNGGFVCSQADMSAMFSYVRGLDSQDSRFHTFFQLFYNMQGFLNNIVIENIDYFRNYLKNTADTYIENSLKTTEPFIKLIIEENRFDLIDLTNYSQDYSADNLKLLSAKLSTMDELPRRLLYCGPQVPQRIFELKDQFNSEEFYNLLSILRDKGYYDRAVRNSPETIFTMLVKENFDYLINMMDGKEFLPKCLMESPDFRDECIRRNRFDLATQCLLPEDIMDNETVVEGYCEQLNISPTVFYSRMKWLKNYSKMNINLFNSVLGSSLKDGVFNIDKKHYERLINDVDIQQGIAKLNNAELGLLSKVLDNYSFKDYDISLMVTKVVGNIRQYRELTSSLDMDNITQEQLNQLISVIQNPRNPYQINTAQDLENYSAIKKQFFVDNFNGSDLDSNKSNLLQAVFNFDLQEAQYIYTKFCHNEQMIERLKTSELPKENLEQLLLIDRIINCGSQEELANIYNAVKDNQVYNNCLPLETCLKAVYTNLYNQSIYSPIEKDQVYGPKEHIMKETEYNGNTVQVCVPRENFKFLVHVVGTCSVAGDNTSGNYQEDWLGRPQMQDHFVCCSYISEKEVFSLRDGSSGSIIMGFDDLENGSILAMGNNDIDSTGISRAYNGSRVVQDLNGTRAQYFVPSELTRAAIAKGGGYNEIVIERRDESTAEDGIAKRKPSYIIMPTDSMRQDNFTKLNELYQSQLSFLNEEDILEIENAGNDRSKISQVLVKYKSLINDQAIEKNVELKSWANHLIGLVLKGKYYENCLKAASEFSVPLVVVDREYYFQKVLNDTNQYSEEMKTRIMDFYRSLNSSKKPKLLNLIVQGKDVTDILPPPTNTMDN